MDIVQSAYFTSGEADVLAPCAVTLGDGGGVQKRVMLLGQGGHLQHKVVCLGAHHFDREQAGVFDQRVFARVRRGCVGAVGGGGRRGCHGQGCFSFGSFQRFAGKPSGPVQSLALCCKYPLSVRNFVPAFGVCGVGVSPQRGTRAHRICARHVEFSWRHGFLLIIRGFVKVAVCNADVIQ